MGLPVVAYAQGALPEVLGGAGVLVDSVDPYRLAATIADLLADPARWPGVGARRVVSSSPRWTWTVRATASSTWSARCAEPFD